MTVPRGRPGRHAAAGADRRGRRRRARHPTGSSGSARGPRGGRLGRGCSASSAAPSARARYWIWRGHWAWPERTAAGPVRWPGRAPASRRAARATRAMGADWLRPVAVLAGVAFIAIVSLGVQPLPPGDRPGKLYRADRRPDVRRCGHRRQRHAERGRRRDADQRRAQHGGPPTRSRPGSTAAPGLEGRVAVPAGRGRRDANRIERADRGGRLRPPCPLRRRRRVAACPTPTATGSPSTVDGHRDPGSPDDRPADARTSTARRRPTPGTRQPDHRPTPATGSPTPTDTGTGSPTATPSGHRQRGMAARRSEQRRLTDFGSARRSQAGRTANLACMEWLAPVAGPPVFLVRPGSLDAEVVTLSGPEGHHAAAVRRLRPGERADVSDGAGTIAECAVSSVARDSVTLSVRSVAYGARRRSRGSPSSQALPKGDRGELAVELMTEVGVDAVIPWAARALRRPLAGRPRRARARQVARHRPRGRQAVPPRLASRGPGPGLASRRREASVGRGLRGRPRSGRGGALSRADPPGPGRDRCWWSAPKAASAPPSAPRSREAGAVEARLGPTVLRTSTAGAAAAAVLLTRTSRW